MSRLRARPQPFIFDSACLLFPMAGDIAARNVLVGAQPLDVKLSDLGAARNVKTQEDYTYISTDNNHMPVRWMAIEAIRDVPTLWALACIDAQAVARVRRNVCS